MKFSSQGETAHKTAKQQYVRTNRSGYIRQVAKNERVQANLTYMEERRNQTRDDAPVHPIDDESECEIGHYRIGKRGSDVLEIRTFMEVNATDPAAKVRMLRA